MRASVMAIQWEKSVAIPVYIFVFTMSLVFENTKGQYVLFIFTLPTPNVWGFSIAILQLSGHLLNVL